MGTIARRIAVEIVGDSSSLERAFKRSSRSAGNFNKDIDKTGKGKKTFGGIKNSAAGMAGSFIGVSAAMGGIKTAIGDASDLQEEIGKNKVVFKDSAGEIEAWSKTTADSLGISQAKALKATGTLGNMLVPMGTARGKAADMSKTMVNLAGDMASFNNASPEDTLDALRSALAGESEPMRRFGADIRDAALEQFALSKGMKTAVKDMKPQQKAQLIYEKILSDTKDAQGDAARTGNQWAGVQRRLGALVEDLSAKLGKTLVPKLTEAAGAVADWLSKTKNQKAIMKTVTGIVDALKTAVGFLKGAFDLLSGAVGGNKNAIKFLVGAYATWKVLSFASRVSTLAGNIGGLTGRLKTSATRVQTFGTNATVAGGKTKGLTGKAKGLKGAMGKAGVAGGVALAAWGLSDLIRQIPGWDKKMKNFGASIYDFAGKLGLVNDELEKFEGFKMSSQADAGKLRQQANRLRAHGKTPQQAAAILRRQNPNVHRRDIDVYSGVTARTQTTNIGTVVLPNVANMRQLEGEFTRRSKRRPHPRRG